MLGNGLCSLGSTLLPDFALLPGVTLCWPLVPDVEVVLVSALAGAAMATTVPPRAASPNVKTAAALAMRVLIR